MTRGDALNTALLGALDRLEAETTQADPVQWCAERLKMYLTPQQREIADSVVRNRFTAVPAAHGLGKTFSASALTAWWVETKEDPIVVTTAPSAAQVRALLWRELRQLHARAGLTGKITDSGFSEWKIGNRIVAFGRKPADYDTDTFQGIHALHVLVVIDEASGVAPALWTQVDTLVTNSTSRVLAIGNPDDPSSEFANACKPDSGYHVIRLDALRSPTLTASAVKPYPELARLIEAEGIPLTPDSDAPPPQAARRLTGPLWINERITRWGTASALWTAKVRGIFPEDSIVDAVIPLAAAQRATERYVQWHEAGRPIQPGRPVIGVDVARSGLDGDDSVIAIRTGDVVRELIVVPGRDLTAITGRVAALLRTTDGAIAVVDETGIGAGVLDRLAEQGLPAYGFVAAGRSTATDRSGEFPFLNVRAESWWRVREALTPYQPTTPVIDPVTGLPAGEPYRAPTGRTVEDGTTLLAIPDDDMLLAELTAPRWKLTSTGKIQVESKDEIRKRLGRSTDRADAVVMSLWHSARVSNADTLLHRYHEPTLDERALVHIYAAPGGPAQW